LAGLGTGRFIFISVGIISGKVVEIAGKPGYLQRERDFAKQNWPENIIELGIDFWDNWSGI